MSYDTSLMKAAAFRGTRRVFPPVHTDFTVHNLVPRNALRCTQLEARERGLVNWRHPPCMLGTKRIASRIQRTDGRARARRCMYSRRYFGYKREGKPRVPRVNPKSTLACAPDRGIRSAHGGGGLKGETSLRAAKVRDVSRVPAPDF